jgi:hypothetical protein
MVVPWIGFGVAQMGNLPLEVRDAVQGDPKFLVIRNHDASFSSSTIPRDVPSLFKAQPATISSSDGKQASRLTQKMLAPKCDCATAWSNSRHASPETAARSNESSITRKTSTSFGLALSETNDPKTMVPATCPAPARRARIRSSRRPTRRRIELTAPNRSMTSAAVARWTPGGRSPAGVRGVGPRLMKGEDGVRILGTPANQPAKYCKTSGLYRTLTSCFVGATCGPRCPRLRFSARAARTAAYPPPRTTTASFHLASSAAEGLRSLPGAAAIKASHSAGVAGRLFGVAPDFMFHRLANTDDARFIASLRVGCVICTTIPLSQPSRLGSAQ